MFPKRTLLWCLSRWAYPASKGITDISAHGYEAETAEAKKISHIQRMMEAEGVHCCVLMVADAPLGRRVSRAVRVLVQRVLSQTSTCSLSHASRMTGRTTMPSLKLFELEYRALTGADKG